CKRRRSSSVTVSSSGGAVATARATGSSNEFVRVLFFRDGCHTFRIVSSGGVSHKSSISPTRTPAESRKKFSRAGSRVGEPGEGRQHLDHPQVRRFQTAPRIQLPRGRQQRHLSPGPLRGPGGV